MKKIVVISGAGISAESGISTFRDSDGLWRKHRFEDLASPKGWKNNPELVLEFYNQRRKQLFDVHENAAHKALKLLEEKYKVVVITQNVDDLHERAGSSNVIHLHGELKKARSTADERLVYELKDWALNMGDKCELGSQLRPHIVWFGESVPMFDVALKEMHDADIILVIGTSLVVYPAASLIHCGPPNAKIFIIDPKAQDFNNDKIISIKQKAGTAVPELVEKLLNNNYE